MSSSPTFAVSTRTRSSGLRLAHLFAFADWRSWAVFRRNARVYLRNWRTAFLPPAMEPVIYLLAFGLGLASYVETVPWNGRELSYTQFIAPGLVAYAAFSTPFFEALYSAYVRMFYQKTWDGILATQVELHHLVWGEILWAGARGAMNSTVVTIVLGVFNAIGFIDIAWPWLFVMPFACGIVGCAFAALALTFTAIVPSIDHMNYPAFLIGLPIGFVSNTFFPAPADNAVVRVLMEINPVYHLAETCRSLLVTGTVGVQALKLVLSAFVLLAIVIPIVLRLMRRRVLGD
jgi:lipooligosaccharide transport system permease protein